MKTRTMSDLVSGWIRAQSWARPPTLFCLNFSFASACAKRALQLFRSSASWAPFHEQRKLSTGCSRESLGPSSFVTTAGQYSRTFKTCARAFPPFWIFHGLAFSIRGFCLGQRGVEKYRCTHVAPPVLREGDNLIHLCGTTGFFNRFVCYNRLL